jgi:protein required for attachment to host cells
MPRFNREEALMRKPKSWVVLASGSEANFCERMAPDGELQLMDYWAAPSNPPSRLHDGLGRTFESAASGSMRHAVEPRHNPRRVAEDAFARRVCELLDHAIDADSVGELTVVAPPRFLGELRKHMSERIRAIVRAEIGKDLTKLSLEEIPAYLQQETRSMHK